MGSLYQSEEMSLIHIYLQSEAAFSCVSELGELGVVQFRDLNENVNSFNRKFVAEVRRCDEMERKLRFLEEEMKRDNIRFDDHGENPLAPAPKQINELESKLEKFESDMKEVKTNQQTLKKNFLELTELKHILRKAQNFFEEASQLHTMTALESVASDDEAPLLRSELSAASAFTRLGFVAGVVLRERVPGFERVLWRACRGNVFLRCAEIETPFEDPNTGDKVHKSVFIIFFQGDQLKTRVKNICEGFHATLYPCPETAQERREIAIGVMTRIEDLQTVLNQTADHRRMILSQIAVSIRSWFIMVKKTKAIYHTLNLFNVNMADKCLIAEGWCSRLDLDQIRFALRRGTEQSGSSVASILQEVKTEKQPPTYNRTDKFTSSFQAIIDAFGIATYREVNPAPYTIITFPFLFAVMFGDLGHGLIMFLFALFLVLNENRYLNNRDPPNEIWEMIFGGRYLILFMGFFSIYTGFLYNECFSRSINLFGTAWNVSSMPLSEADLEQYETIMLDPLKPGVFRGHGQPYPNGSGDPYQYGMDPIWQSAENKISFQNSYKMKSSVILGMAQMLFGLALAYRNHRFFKNKLALLCEWIPQMIFIHCIVGYLCFLIVLKWTTVKDPQAAPSLLIGLINMFMFSKPADGLFLFAGQTGLQTFLVVLAVICIPWMLLAKPIVLYRRHQKPKEYALLVDPDQQQLLRDHHTEGSAAYASVSVLVDHQGSDDDVMLHHHDRVSMASSSDSSTMAEDDEFNMGEIMIYQIIHTIEYCLNCISHTASYLRLWALSLAHSELSEVLWTMVMSIGLSVDGSALGGVMTYFVFGFFATLTVSILLVMEGLSAFLHALRLHWVEFQSKFYKGDGYPFEPFSFAPIVDARREE